MVEARVTTAISSSTARSRPHVAGNLGGPQSCVTGLVDTGPIAVAGSHVYFSAQSASGFAIYDLLVK